MRHPCSLLASLVVIGAPVVAAAQPSAVPSAAQPAVSTSAYERAYLGLEASAGLGTPLGLTGVSLVVAPRAWLDVELGAGLGLSGPQGAAMVRFTPDRVVSLGAGVSLGPYHA